MWKQGIGLEDRMDVSLVGWDVIDTGHHPAKISPVVASSKPAMMLRIVDFPEPDAPRRV